MGKLICDTTSNQPVLPWLNTSSTPPPDSENPTTTTAAISEAASWDDVIGLEEQQRRHMTRLHEKGVLWRHPQDKTLSAVFRLSHGGAVDHDGNCLFTAARRSMGVDLSPRELRARVVARFLQDLENADQETKSLIQSIIINMYSPDLSSGWGVHVVQEVKFLARKQDREALDAAIDELVRFGGMQREFAAESVYKERCLPVRDGDSWAKYMSVSGSVDDEYHIVSLQYTEEGLLTVDENRDGKAAAFGDDIAIECMATEFKREIFVVQAHGVDGMVDEDNCVFFLPHRPRSEILEPPFFLFMKGTGWCGAGADHYEPLVAHRAVQTVPQEKVALVL